VWIIATLRSDFWHRAAEIPEMVNLCEGQGRIDLAAPSAAELQEMIRKPAQVAGLSFESHPITGLGLDAILAEHAAAAPGALPLLSFTLGELYQSTKARGEAVFTHAAYEALEGIGGAIAKRADEFVLSNPGSEGMILRIFTLKLATVHGDGEPLRRRALQSDFSEEEWRLVMELANSPYRLLVTAGSGTGETYAEVAHEAIFRRWDKLSKRILAEREFLAWRARFEMDRRIWQHNNSAVLTGPTLTHAYQWLRTRGTDLSEIEKEFIKQSIATEHAKLKRVRGKFYVALLLAITALAITLFTILSSYLR
jgi:hypothetical protein